METLTHKRRGRPRVAPEDRPIPLDLSLKDVEELTRLKIVDVEERKNTLVAILANGFRWHIRKW